MAPPRGGGGGDKKQRFVEAIVKQKLEGVRWGVAHAGVAPATRLEAEMTSFMLACAHGKDRSLAELIRWYERRLNQLRECLEQRHEETGQTAMHIACGHPNGTKCVEALLEAWQRVEPKRPEAGVSRPADSAGKVPMAYARGKTREVIDDWLAEPETDEDEEVGEDGLTSTQRSKLKKKALEANERRGTKAPAEAASAPAADDERGELPGEMPEPTWPEVRAWVDSVKKLRPICELSVTRGDDDDPRTLVVDPALWYCHSLNRLQLRLGPSLVALHGPGLAKLANLSTLIVAGHALAALPDSVADLPLKSLDASRNRLASLPAAMPASLEALDLSHNDLDDLAPLKPCVSLVTLALDANPRLDALDLDFPALKRLATLSASACALDLLPPAVGALAKLETLVLNDSPLTELPTELANCKKLKVLKVDNTRIADNKVLSYVNKAEIKQLFKYLEKNANGPRSAAKGGGGKKGKR